MADPTARPMETHGAASHGATTWGPGFVLRGTFALWLVSCRRLVFSTSTAMLLFPFTFCVIFVLARRYGQINDAGQAFRKVSEELFVSGIYSLFLLPLVAIAFATTALGRDREDRTLLYLLIRPLPRPCILLAKLAATLPIVIITTWLSAWILCELAGKAGREAFQVYWPALGLLATSYTCLFILFGVVFRHATILAVVYALFMELFLGNLPGIIKRLAVNFYGRSLMLAWGEPHGVRVPQGPLFQPVEADTAWWTLCAISLVSTLLAFALFQIREYRDLT